MQDQHNVHLSENLKTCIYVNTFFGPRGIVRGGQMPLPNQTVTHL